MDQHNIEIFSCFLRLLPLYSSTFHQTNVENAKDRSEETPTISSLQSLHLLLEVDDHIEEEYSIVLTLRNRLENNLLAQHQSTSFPRWVKFLWMGWQEHVSVVLLLAFDRLAKARACDFNAKLSNCISEVELREQIGPV